MKNRVYGLLIGSAFALATCDVSQAMSHLLSISIEPEWPVTSDPETITVQ